MLSFRSCLHQDLPTKLQKKAMKHAALCTSPSSVNDQYNWASRHGSSENPRLEL